MWGLRSGFSSKIRRKVREELLRGSFYGDIGSFQGIFLLARDAKLVELFHLQENVEYRTPNDEVKCRASVIVERCEKHDDFQSF